MTKSWPLILIIIISVLLAASFNMNPPVTSTVKRSVGQADEPPMQQQWVEVVRYADKISAKAEKAEQYFQ